MPNPAGDLGPVVSLDPGTPVGMLRLLIADVNETAGRVGVAHA